MGDLPVIQYLTLTQTFSNNDSWTGFKDVWMHVRNLAPLCSHHSNQTVAASSWPEQVACGHNRLRNAEPQRVNSSMPPNTTKSFTASSSKGLRPVEFIERRTEHVHCGFLLLKDLA
jgi:hypothetical protein